MQITIRFDSRVPHGRGVSDSHSAARPGRVPGTERRLAPQHQASQGPANGLDSTGGVYFDEINFLESVKDT